MLGFHLWDLLIIAFFLGIAALILGVIVWAVRRPTKVIVVPMYVPPPPLQEPSQMPGQPGGSPYASGPYQQPDQYPGQPPAHDPPQ
jgi:hypothetical protein